MRSRASSTASESNERSLKVETPQGDIASASQLSPTESMMPRTSASGEDSITASSFGSFNAVNFPSSANDAPSSTTIGASSATGNSGTPGNYNQTSSSFAVRPGTGRSSQDLYSRLTQPEFEIYPGAETMMFSNYTTTHALPLLRIPEEPPSMPGLSYTQENSPWCSSASDSTYSTHSDQWIRRGRSASIATIPDWSASALAAQWPSLANSTSSQDLRSPPFDAILEQFETPYASPRMSPPSSSHQLLDVPTSFGGYYMESVGTPAPSTYNKPLAQTYSASTPRVSDSGLASIIRRPKELVESHQLGTFTTDVMASGQFSFVQFDPYLLNYWRFFDPQFPIIHRGTFDSSANALLSAAMAAIGSQYSDTFEARQSGMIIHDYCRKNLDLVCLLRSL